MFLKAGTRLGSYEVLSSLGAGGMGEVYRARDTKLGRDVALKVISQSFTYDPERVARFEREAQLLAALNHPHIAGVYGLEHSDGAQVLAMELVEGGTLADRLAAGPLPVAEALAIARQIADALQAAHDKGIIHRDLKPANIALTADGQVKVLDFGLAKALDASPASDIALSPTLSLAATQAGVILGTAAYMAPEQARGKPADKRADIWAFGCVLYEMLTGQRAFGGEDTIETLGFIVAREPDWSALPPVPLAIGILIRRCLEKDRHRRVGDIAAALLLLEEAPRLAEASRSAAEPSSPVGQAHWRRALPLAVIGTALVVGPAVWSFTRPSLPPLVRTTMATERPTVLSINGFDRDLAITPDGSRIVYRGSAGQLFVRALDRLDPTALTGLGDPRGPFLSPDGDWIGFFDGNSALKKVASTGGPPVTITASDGAGPRGATWLADDTIIYATNTTTTGLFRTRGAGGDSVLLTTPDPKKGESDHLWPESLPGGRFVLFTITPLSGGIDNAQIAALDLQTGAIKVLVRGGSHAHYVPTGHLVYGAAGTLRAVSFDLDRMEVAGAAVPVLEGVVTTAQGAADVGIAGNGTLVYVRGTGGVGALRSLVWVDRAGREEPLAAPPRAYFFPRISPDGTRVALDIRDQENDIWIWDFMRETLTRLTFDPTIDQAPVWMPDSRRVLFGSQRSGPSNVFAQAADGTGTVERLSEATVGQIPHTVTPDGAGIVIRVNNPKTALDLVLIPLKPPREPQPLVVTAFSELNAEISPDGRWLAYQSNESGRHEIYVRPFPAVETGRWQVSTSGGRWPLWSCDGRELFYVGSDNLTMGVRVEADPAWRNSSPVPVVQRPYFSVAGNNGRSYDISPDGRRFLMIKDRIGDDDGAAQSNVVIVQNWTEELKRLVPAN